MVVVPGRRVAPVWGRSHSRARDGGAANPVARGACGRILTPMRTYTAVIDEVIAMLLEDGEPDLCAQIVGVQTIRVA